MAKQQTTDPATTGAPEKKPPFSATSSAPGGDGKSAFNLKTGKRRKPVIIGGVVIIVLVIALVVVGAFWLVDTVTYVSTDDAIIDGQKVNISAKILGRIKSLEVNEGDTVAAGQILVYLDDTDLRSQEKAAAAQLTSAKVNRDGAEEEYQRTKGLYANGAATKQQLDHASQAADAAEAQYHVVQAQLGVIETQLSNTRITSPIPGTVAKRSFAVGDVVQPSQTILTVNNLSNVWVTANFEETKIGRIAEGAEVEITVDAYPGVAFHGRVARTGSGVLPPPFQIGEFTKTTQRVPFRIDFADVPEGIKLLPGLSVEVKVRAK